MVINFPRREHGEDERVVIQWLSPCPQLLHTAHSQYGTWGKASKYSQEKLTNKHGSPFLLLGIQKAEKKKPKQQYNPLSFLSTFSLQTQYVHDLFTLVYRSSGTVTNLAYTSTQ